MEKERERERERGRERERESESESEMYLFDPHKQFIQSNNQHILDQGTPFKTSLVANIRATYYIINTFFSYDMLKIHNKVIHDYVRMSLYPWNQQHVIIIHNKLLLLKKCHISNTF